MIVKLISHTFPDKPNWEIVEKTVPLGTVYEVIGYQAGGEIGNLETRERRKVSGMYLLDGNGDIGWMPCELFEHVKES